LSQRLSIDPYALLEAAFAIEALTTFSTWESLMESGHIVTAPALSPDQDRLISVPIHPDLASMREICSLTNELSYALDGLRNTCIFTSAALCDALIALGIPSRMMRVDALVDIDGNCTLLGSFGDGSRRTAAARGMWHGHVAVVADERFLLDPTLDQARGAAPFVSEVTDEFLAGEQLLFWVDGVRYTNYPGPSSNLIRYSAYPHLCGWKGAPDFRYPRRRRSLVDDIVRTCESNQLGRSLALAA
jgi:hypothetical protein